jgi:hypothetical protein
MQNENIKKVARIVKCDESFVKKVLKGDVPNNTPLAGKILKAKQLLEDLDRELEARIRENIQRTFDETPDNIKKAMEADFIDAYRNGMWKGVYERLAVRWGYAPGYLRQIYPLGNIVESAQKQSGHTPSAQKKMPDSE